MFGGYPIAGAPFGGLGFGVEEQPPEFPLSPTDAWAAIFRETDFDARTMGREVFFVTQGFREWEFTARNGRKTVFVSQVRAGDFDFRVPRRR